MTLNGTLIVQLCNFLCAYVILDILLLRPVMAIIWQEDELKESKIKAVKAERNAYEVQQGKIARLWEAFKKDFKQARPFVTRTRAAFPVAQRPAVSQVTTEETASLVKAVADILVERCSQVRK